MTVFKSQLVRCFALGFAIGAVAVAAVSLSGNHGVQGAIVPAAVAAAPAR